MAAAEQGRNWQFVTLFYRNQGPERLQNGTPSISVVGPGGRKDLGGGAIPQLAEIQAAIAAVQ